MEPTTSTSPANSLSTTSLELRLTIRGIPGPKGSRNPGKGGKTYEQSKVAVKWMEDVAVQARALMGNQLPLPPPYGVSISFAMPKPKTPTYAWPVVGDLDKLVRATLDGLQKGGAILEDKHVIALAADEQFADGVTGAVIHIESLPA